MVKQCFMNFIGLLDRIFGTTYCGAALACVDAYPQGMEI
tara:strand:- start:3196 stop:3312 length:117 start_codon:yes stop_codon:yes gene_type:complete